MRAARGAKKGFCDVWLYPSVKSELRVREADRFQQVYCGLCHAIRARYGRFYTLFLSYDMTFFVLVAGAERRGTPPPCRKRCDAHPLLKRPAPHPTTRLRLRPM